DVGREVHGLGVSGGMEEIEAEQSDEGDQQECSRAGTEKAVIKADSGTDEDRQRQPGSFREGERFLGSTFLACVNINRNDGEENENDRLDQFRIDDGNSFCSTPGKKKGADGDGEQDSPTELYFARVLESGDCGAADGREF